ncbi:MAG: glycoside hydrolase family 43 protein [Bacteroidaceae bacterium]|nr:glycoside hydrolase family 43 protein [Bacteroidaceae bacterium]
MKLFVLAMALIMFPLLGRAVYTPAGCKKVKTQSRLPLADPYVLLEGDTYYAYGTHSDDGIEVFTSTDMLHWKNAGLALSRSNTTESRWFWAPEVYHLNGKYYMYYSANEHIYVATSDSPLGPFRQVGDSPLLATGSIDTSLFIDDDGKVYLFFVNFNNGNEVWVVQLEEGLTSLKYETLHRLLGVSQDWEMDPNFPGSRVNEGPFVMKQDGVYYLTYSANDYQSQHYGIGLATATSIMGEWTKSSSNPIFQHEGGLVGTGHHSFFTDKEGQLQMIFHAHNSAEKVHPRLSYIVKAGLSASGYTFGKRILIPLSE